MIYVMSPSGKLEQVFAKATASYVSCNGNAVHVIDRPIVPTDFPLVDTTALPELQVGRRTSTGKVHA